MKKDSKKPIQEDTKYQLAGWVLFILCAVLYAVSSLRNHDILSFIGSLIFLIACLVFLVPVVKSIRKRK